MAKKSKIEKNFWHNIKEKTQKASEIIDEEYLCWIRSLMCCVEGCNRPSVPHHIKSRKLIRNDHQVINVCGIHHNLGGIHDAIHQMGKYSWQKKFNIDIEELANSLYEKYLKEQNGK